MVAVNKVVNQKIPSEFRDIIKLESTLAGKTMTRYLRDLARESERTNISIQHLLKEKRRSSNVKKTFNFKI